MKLINESKSFHWAREMHRHKSWCPAALSGVETMLRRVVAMRLNDNADKDVWGYIDMQKRGAWSAIE